MKIKYVNEKGQSIEFKYSRPFCLGKMEGLGFENELGTMNLNGYDGSTVISENLDSRYITIPAILITTQKIQVNRMKRQLFKVFNPKLKGELTVIKKGVKDRKIQCKVSGLSWGRETILTQDFIVRLFCPSPFFTDIQETKQNIAYWINDFHFPLEISKEGIEMGHKAESLIVNVLNNGDIETGMKIKFIARGSLKNPSFFNVNTREFIKINTDMKAGDIVTVTTSKGNKRVILTDTNSVESNISSSFSINSTFLQLDIGDNLFRYDTDENIDNLEVSIYYTQKYLGA